MLRGIVVEAQHHKASNKHVAGKEALANRESCERDIAKAMQLYDKQEQPSGQTLPEAQRVYRIKVVTTFLRAMVETVECVLSESKRYSRNSK